MFTGFLKSIFSMLFDLLKWPVLIIGGVLFLFFFFTGVFFILEYRKGRRLNPGAVRRLPKESVLGRIFIDAPKMYVEDMYNRPPDFFRPQGMVIFCGRQGMGKTVSMFQYVQSLQYQYPKCKVLSNTPYIYQDGALNHWRQLIEYKNGKNGVVVVMDELQNWFSSNQSRNFPPEMLSVITQNRKNRRLILGTSQNFYLLAKPIRSQATEVRNCITLGGVLTIVLKREPVLDSEGDVKEMKHRGMYFFVHTKKLRDSYNTWATVESLSRSGFHANPFLMMGETKPEKNVKQTEQNEKAVK